MKMKPSICIIAVLLVTASCNQNDSSLPADFAVRLEGGFSDMVDTFEKKYTRSAVLPRMRDSTIDFEFTLQEKNRIYYALNNMDYGMLPEHVSTQCDAYIDPSHTIKLTVRANGITKHIIYVDGCITKNKQAVGVSKVINLIGEISAKHKEVQQIPQTTMMLDM
jgi:hypothetical protein